MGCVRSGAIHKKKKSILANGWLTQPKNKSGGGGMVPGTQKEGVHEQKGSAIRLPSKPSGGCLGLLSKLRIDLLATIHGGWGGGRGGGGSAD